MIRNIIFLLVLFPLSLVAQNHGPLFKQFGFNPYPFNPAFAGINNQAELNLSYRKQWVNFQDAPATAGLNLQIPTSDRVVLGVNILSDKQVLLKNHSLLASFVYVLPITEDQTLRFGISGGIGMNGLNLSAEEMNTNDPVIMNASGTNYYADGNFGVVYTYGGLKLGAALTSIFKSASFSEETFNKFSMSNLKNRFYSASYRFNAGVSENMGIEPYLLFQETNDGIQDYWEAGVLTHFDNKLSIGASYSQNNILALLLGITVKDKLRVSYSYEFPPLNQSSLLSASSHEFQLNLRFGKELSPPSKVSRLYRKYTRYKGPGKNYTKKPVVKNPAKNKHNMHDAEKEKITAKDTVLNVAKDESSYTKQEPPVNMTSVDSLSESLPANKELYCVVVGAFSAESRALAMARKLLYEGLYVQIISDAKQMFYVYVFASHNLEEARNTRDKYRRKIAFQDAWIFTVKK
jgi:type IX secretion system PorP/SprF family membrane protein